MTEPSRARLSRDDPRLKPDSWPLIAKRLSSERRQRFEEVAQKRTKKVRLVFQDIFDPHNIAACLRSAEAFGVQLIDIVTTYQSYSRWSPDLVSRGSSRWLTIRHWKSIKDCAQSLRDVEGYGLVAGFPPARGTVRLDGVPVNQPLAVVFGNEQLGLAAEWEPYLGCKFSIPMVGMVESLNVSVSAALTLFELTNASRCHFGESHYYIDQDEAISLCAYWACQEMRFPDLELRRLLE